MSVIARVPAPSSLSDQAVEALREEILSCRLPPGAAVSETLMTERLTMGRAPVRAALARLADEGLVQAVPRRGWMVSLVTVRDIHEVFDLRLILEPEAARRAAGKGDPARLRQLDAVCQQGHRPDDPDSALRFLCANRAFHVTVAELAGNQRLARQVGRLLDESTRMLVLGLSQRDRSGEMAHEHRALIAALAEGDGPRAAAIMHEQVSASRDMVLAALTGPHSSLVVSEVA
ncbi:GntR family transcriptional regulator [Limobrevibacterium gyesilva]|uniref:GntR family transcriptional regulator n=1 Tax=Limobrevibacterium gyesilva TaxID=2991712 RepID=A0AA41YI83_9PROT|nr:GntR family transcriptional regulator [Limobrevibacterium gyesilva]MCW3473991.1 GntR family transcriptional regulator [Limobrevibacterium gyesilva]